MKFETSWRFYSFNYRIRRTKQFDNMPLLHKYESLFTKSVHQISMDLSETNYSSINNLAQWLESVAMKPKARFRVNFVGSFLPLSNPSVVTESDYEADTPDDLTEAMMRDLSLYTNLRELNLWRKFPVSSLKWFPCLTSLFLRHLDCSNVTNVENLPNIAVLDIGVQENSDIELLPVAINKFFPCLEYFGLGLEKNTNVDADFSCLPTSCQFLQIPSYLLRNFANCCHLKSLYLINDGELAESFDHFQHGSQLQVKLLQVLYLYGSCRPRSSLFGIVSDLITQWKSLEVISIKMGGYTMGRGALFPPFEFDMDDLFDGKRNFESEEFLQQLEEMRKMWIDSNVQILIFGQTVWMKKSTNSVLLRSLNDIDVSFPSAYWRIKPVYATLSFDTDFIV